MIDLKNNNKIDEIKLACDSEIKDGSQLVDTLLNKLAGRVSKVPDFTGTASEYLEKLEAYDKATETGVFFNAELGRHGGLLHIRDQKSLKSNKSIVLRFDIDWQNKDGADIGGIKFADLERKIYPDLVSSIEQIKLVSGRDNLLDNEVRFTGPVSEKFLNVSLSKGRDVLSELRHANVRVMKVHENEVGLSK